ncbi:MAG: ATPase, partial [Alphaproteobacteria bacterium]|nr:ATPase [Alphaproteobacteria bacterium]
LGTSHLVARQELRGLLGVLQLPAKASAQPQAALALQ